MIQFVPYFTLVIGLAMLVYELKFQRGKNWKWYALFWLAVSIWSFRMAT